MPFKRGNRAALTISKSRLDELAMALVRAGYTAHKGRKVKLRGEIVTLKKDFQAGRARRQCHVQVLEEADGRISVFAHTEPSMSSILDVLAHGYAALTDKVSYQAGAKMVKRDLERVRFRV